jgi:hypothetical protein
MSREQTRHFIGTNGDYNRTRRTPDAARIQDTAMFLRRNEIPLIRCCVTGATTFNSAARERFYRTMSVARISVA